MRTVHSIGVLTVKFNINRNEVLSASLLLVIGIATIIGSFNYQVGTLARMGPGYFPLALGVIITFLGVLVGITPVVEAAPVEDDDEEEKQSWFTQIKTWVLVISSVIAFIILGKYGGLVPATFVMTTIAAMADKGNSTKAAFVVGIVLTIATVIVFHYGLQMQFQLFTWG